MNIFFFFVFQKSRKALENNIVYYCEGDRGRRRRTTRKESHADCARTGGPSSYDENTSRKLIIDIFSNDITGNERSPIRILFLQYFWNIIGVKFEKK